MGGDGGFCAAAFKRKAAGEIRNGGRRSEKGESGIKNRERMLLHMRKILPG